jgi:protoheme IX farnesyltransferase
MKASSASIRDYYILTKPGIIRGNLLTALGGFGLASIDGFAFGTCLALLTGMALVIGASCVFNNIYDRRIDQQMARTKRRAVASGAISTRTAALFGTMLALVGFTLLLIWTNGLTALLGLIGLVTYAGVYTPAKHRTPYATLIGTIPGAIPPVAGYTAISGRLDQACLLLFLILICWQMPHFYAIAIRRLDEYKAAKVPVWPAVHSLRQTKAQMIWFALAFTVFVIRLSLSGYTGVVFAVLLGGFGLFWTYKCFKGLRAVDDTRWAKNIFLLSLPGLPLFSILLLFNQWLP